MRIIFSSHFQERAKLRKIELTVVQEFLLNWDQHFIDTKTGYFVALKRTIWLNRERDVIVVYVQKNDEIVIVTMHPLRENQKERHIKSGRWLPV